MKDNYPNVYFKGEYLEPILEGRKTQTMRNPPSRWDVKEEDIVVANFTGRSEKLLLQITKSSYKNFGSINDEDAEREGFSNAAELKHVLEEIYSGYVLNDYNRLYYYQFEVIGELDIHVGG